MIYRDSNDLFRNLRNLNRDPFTHVRPWLLDGVDPGVRVEVGSFVIERTFPFTDEDLEGWIADLNEALEAAVARLTPEDDELLAKFHAAGV